MSKFRFAALAAGLFCALPAAMTAAAPAQAQAALNALQAINDKIDAQVVPFKVVIPGGLCDSAGQGTSTAEIVIDSDGAEGEFVVTSIIFGTTVPGVPLTGFEAFSINHLEVDGDRFYIRSGNLLGPTDGSGVYEATDIMGTPSRRNGDSEAPLAGGNFPHQIVAQSNDTDDIHINFFCSSDDDDLSFANILVAGWKRPADTITVTYTPGN
ncbi:hypothetical protein [Pelagibius marinus]|uniref:hypothetical protein n=1 Tax=Pelagibius marinus TaxID=2762760 RepID=UPI00187306F6|nr:hypothetical protein [Pelagibius marinus]